MPPKNESDKKGHTGTLLFELRTTNREKKSASGIIK
jgi:hypothetical protein